MKKKKLFVTALLTAAVLSACNNGQAKVEDDGIVNSIALEADYSLERKDFPIDMDTALNIDDWVSIDEGDEVVYESMIDTSTISEENLNRIHNTNPDALLVEREYLKLMDDKTITDTVKVNDGNIAMSEATFDVYRFYLIPDSISDQVSEFDILNRLDHTINCKMYISDQGNIFYEIDEVVDFTNKQVYIIGEDDYSNTIEAKSLWELTDSGFALISYEQTGLGSKSQNIIDANFNYEKDIIVPIDRLALNDNKEVRRV